MLSKRKPPDVRVPLRGLAFISLFFCSAFLGAIRAETTNSSYFADDEILSIATGRAQSIRVAPSVATVISSTQIRRSGARTLADLMKWVPGVHTNYSFLHFDPVFSFRGYSTAYNQSVLFLVDGVPKSDLFFGDRMLTVGNIPIDMIERLEIVRGPGSALYGADAYVGVVNVITRLQSASDVSVGTGAGTFDTRHAHAFASGKIANVNVTGGYEFITTDGHQPWIERDQQSNLDDLMNTDASLAPSRANSARSHWGGHVNAELGNARLGLRAFRSYDVGMGIGLTGALDQEGKIENSGAEIYMRYARPLTGTLTFSGTLDFLLAKYRFDDVHLFPPGAFGMFPDGVYFSEHHTQETKRAAMDFTYSGFDGHIVLVGTGYDDSELTSHFYDYNYDIGTVNGIPGTIVPLGTFGPSDQNSSFGDPRVTRRTTYIFAQDDWQLTTDLTVTYGVRFDEYSDFGATTNTRAALVWNATRKLTIKLLYGTGFRTPSKLETQSVKTVGLQSNPDLEPEKIRLAEFAFDYRMSASTSHRLSTYRYRTENQIRYVNSGGPTFVPTNADRQTGQGIEYELTIRPDATNAIRAIATYQKNYDEPSHTDSGYTPHITAILGYEKAWQDYVFALSARHIGERAARNDDNRGKVDPYTLVDVHAAIPPLHGVDLALDIGNIFDTRASEAGLGSSFPGHIPLPGRTIMLSARIIR